MELILIVVAFLAVGAWWIWSESKRTKSDSHPLDGPTKSPEPWPFPTSRPPEGEAKDALPVMPTLTAVLDVNKDGRVDLQDAVAAKDVVVAETKKAAKKTKAKAVKIVEATKKVAKKTKAKATEAVKKPKAKKSK